MVLIEAHIYNKQASVPEDLNIDKVHVMNWLIEHNDYKSYLEIGIRYHDCFSRINCLHKIGVDPNTGQEYQLRPDTVSKGKHTFRLTSDEFFIPILSNPVTFESVKFDMVFIDGLHYHEQIDKDIQNALKLLNANGVIVLHDCHPLTEPGSQYPYTKKGGPQNGDGFKSVWKLLEKYPELDFRVIGIDWGLGIIQKQACTIKREIFPKYDPYLRHSILYSLYLERILPHIKVDWKSAQLWLPCSIDKDRNVTRLKIDSTIIPYAKKPLPF